MTEKERISNYNNGELPNGVCLRFEVCCDNADETIEMVKEVISPISIVQNDWYDDEKWKEVLPKWFLNKILKNDIQALQKNKNLWHYGSGLDAMKNRGCEWFSSKKTHSGFEINLEAFQWPYSVNPLEYVILETGVSLEQIAFREL